MNQRMSQLEARIRELESRIDKLHINRRLLLEMIDAMEKESQTKRVEMETKNCRLRRDNCRYARTIMARNIRILELEERLQQCNSQTTS